MKDLGMFEFPGPDCPMLKDRSDCDKLLMSMILLTYGPNAKEKLKELENFIDVLMEERDGGKEEI